MPVLAGHAARAAALSDLILEPVELGQQFGERAATAGRGLLVCSGRHRSIIGAAQSDGNNVGFAIGASGAK